jgi:processing peptidase subunit alpha
MMRRALRSQNIGLGRAVTTFNFGHPDMTEKFPMPPQATAASTTATDTGVVVTRLPNGVRVITHDRQGPQTSVGVYVEAGPIFDPAALPGLSYVMRWSLPTSNLENSLYQIDRAHRAFGASSEHTEVRKRWLGWKLEARTDSWRKPLESLLSCISVPRFPETDIERYRDTMDTLLEEQRWQRPREYVVDQLETHAFFKEPLGNPRLVPPTLNDNCTSQSLIDHWARLFVPSNVIVAGVNVSNTELCLAYENAPFPHSASAPHHQRANSQPALKLKDEAVQYTGGEGQEPEARAKHMGTSPDMRVDTTGALGFKVGGRGDLAAFANSLVLQQVLDIHLEDSLRAFRSEGMDGLRSFYRPYTGAGLLGLTFFGPNTDSTKYVVEAAKTFKSLKFDKDIISAATQRATVAFYHNELEYQRDYLDFLGTSLVGETHVSAADVLKAIRGTTSDTVAKLHQSATNGKASLFATGETMTLPSLRQLGL